MLYNLGGAFNNNNGLLNGIAEGLKSGLEAYKFERERKDRRAEKEAERNQALSMQEGLLKKTLALHELEGQNSLNRAKELAKFKSGLIAQAPKEQKPSVAEQAIDKAAAKDYEDYFVNGGKATTERNIGDVQSALEDLKNKKVSTGGLASALPEFARDYLDPAAKANQDKIRQAVMASLKQTLGAQFTEREGQKIFDLAYNPRQSTEENARRVGDLLEQLKMAAGSKEAAGRYLEEHGTLKGFKGTNPNAEAFYVKEGSPKGLLQEANAASGPKPGDIVDGYIFKGGNPADQKNWEKK